MRPTTKFKSPIAAGLVLPPRTKGLGIFLILFSILFSIILDIILNYFQFYSYFSLSHTLKLIIHLISGQSTYSGQTSRSVTHPEIALARARLTFEFLPNYLPNEKLELTDNSILLIILTPES